MMYLLQSAQKTADRLPMESSNMTIALVANKKYEGKYVAFDPDKNDVVVAFGQDAGVVIKKARAKGIKVPAVIFVPMEDTAYVY